MNTNLENNTKQMEIIDFIKSLYPNENPVPLHAPHFLGNEKKYLAECIDTTFVSYVGKFVTDFEEHCKKLTGANHAVAMVNGTAALQMMFVSAGIGHGDEVVTQALTFAATAAGIKHSGAEPSFIDIDKDTLGMSPESLEHYLKTQTSVKNGVLCNRLTGNKIAAVMPMHTFGHPVRIGEIMDICKKYELLLFEDSAESLGSYYNGQHTGTFGLAGILSFNGNKPVTTGGGGMLFTNDQKLADRARHLSTTAKQKHPWNFVHDEVGFNLRMPNVNAAIGCAQMEYLDKIIANKRETAKKYEDFFASKNIPFIKEPDGCKSNYWLNAMLLDSRKERDEFLQFSVDNGVQARPAWTLMTKLKPYESCYRISVPNAEWIEDRLVNLPSSVRV